MIVVLDYNLVLFNFGKLKFTDQVDFGLGRECFFNYFIYLLTVFDINFVLVEVHEI